MSISGWYHAPAEPSDMAHASLQQLQDGGLAAGADNFAPEHYTRFPDAGEADVCQRFRAHQHIASQQVTFTDIVIA
jgi:hypothetical protein